MSHFADSATSIECKILENKEIAKDTMRVRIDAPAMAQSVVPGQFFMVRNPAGNDPLIGRAFALYDKAQDGSGWIDLVYLVKGKLTTSIAPLKPGNQLAVWGPLGNGFEPKPTKHLIMVAGGIGQTPFLTLAKEALGQQQFGTDRSSSYAERVSFCYGVRSKEYLAGVAEFESQCTDIHLTTDDGSLGARENVTAPLLRLLNEYEGQTINERDVRIVCCGPEIMMEAVSEIAHQKKIPCEVSLETPMACGIGICFSCVAKIGCQEDWDYKRTCVEGPVFDSNQVLWS